MCHLSRYSSLVNCQVGLRLCWWKLERKSLYQVFSQPSLVSSHNDLRMCHWSKLERSQLYHLPSRSKLECRQQIMRMPSWIKLERSRLYQLLRRKTMGCHLKVMRLPIRKLERILMHCLCHWSTMESINSLMLMPSQYFLEWSWLQNLHWWKQILELSIERLCLQNRKLERNCLHCLPSQLQLEWKDLHHLRWKQSLELIRLDLPMPRRNPMERCFMC